MFKDSKIYIAGHKGLLGTALIKRLKSDGYQNIITRTHSKLDLTNQEAVDSFFKKERPEYVFLAAGVTGGILANKTYPAKFLHTNISIQNNVFQAAQKYEAKYLISYGSSCIYPKNCPQPIKEEYLLTGALEPTNEPYAMAKIAAIKLCRYYNEQYGTNFISVMPTNQYGINDNFNLETAHVLPAMIRKFHDAKVSGAKTLVLWGTGEVYREFMCSDDLANGCIFFMENHDAKDIGEFVNIGTGVDLKIKELANIIKDVVGFNGGIVWDTRKPDGTPKKLLDVSKLTNLGWKSKISLEEGIKNIYEWYLEKK